MRSNFIKFWAQKYPMCKTRITVTTTRTTGRTIWRNNITFDEGFDIKFESAFNTTNPKESKRKCGIFRRKGMDFFSKTKFILLIFFSSNTM